MKKGRARRKGKGKKTSMKRQNFIQHFLTLTLFISLIDYS